ncbi:hypothetical protein WA1_15315 [Scytonema hofmannii PCC 7110]|uniref:Uncharacterized protein n=1 Tax=Scytonema hofmannii PCC 7110 TaxID=128403 RepID=A0A139XDD8_9CYAN|nr:hypothetical protein [Scytonema hofmannii]KYC42708.1 hypothetical protein WA1_15315 [Scytonema hofmannii PCC 7110]
MNEALTINQKTTEKIIQSCGMEALWNGSFVEWKLCGMEALWNGSFVEWKLCGMEVLWDGRPRPSFIYCGQDVIRGGQDARTTSSFGE